MLTRQYPTTFRFFDLPRELRDAIYGYVLVPETAIEFAPWIGCDHEWDYEDWWLKLGDDADDYSNWHWRRWNNIIRPSLALLRVCRQMHSEGSSIYYGQPFRFSSDTGWVALHHWLQNIGSRNQLLLRDITVCHPALCILHSFRAPSLFLPEDLYRNHLEPFGLGSCPSWYTNSTLRWPSFQDHS